VCYRLGFMLVGLGLLLLLSGCAIRGGDSESDEILFVRGEGKRAAIYLMSADDGAARRLVNANAARWSPDGSRFAYRVDDYGETSRSGTSLWLMNPDTGERRRIVDRRNEDLGVYSFAWAPDGQRLAYTDSHHVFVLDS
jgi:dipeptidyl aminopeptidase/acylaminoacyl peptidase